jgi:hypothetical protein
LQPPCNATHPPARKQRQGYIFVPSAPMTESNFVVRRNAKMRSASRMFQFETAHARPRRAHVHAAMSADDEWFRDTSSEPAKD